jgi:hypothetical protein
MAERELHLYFHVLQTLERLGVPYVIIGAFAGTSYGVTRTTLDVDIVVDLNEAQIDALASTYPPPRFYADAFQMRECVHLGTLFNIIDTTAGRKVDLIPLTMKPGYGFALARRIRREIATREGGAFEAWFARPEDVIVGKLMAWKEGRSLKHELDIRDILTAMRLGDEAAIAASFDAGYIDRWAHGLGREVDGFWRSLKQIVS